MPFELNRVVEILDSSSTSPQLIAKLVEARTNSAAQLLASSLAYWNDCEKVDRILEMYGELEQSSQLRVLVSAELGEVLNLLQAAHGLPDPASLDTILDIIAREHAIAAFDNDIETAYLHTSDREEIFSPLADRVLIRTAGGAWEDRPVHIIDGMIVVDFDSPLARRHEPDSGTLSNTPLEISDEEKSTAVEKLTRALHNIDQACPGHGQIIRNFVRRIVIRKSIEADVSFRNVDFAPFGSEHRPIHPSSLRMLNVQHPQNTVTMCMEALFHETVHNVLAYWETVNEYFAPSARDVRPISPWTGNAIPNHSFAHAVFVWYGLHRLFESGVKVAHRLDGIQAHDLTLRLRTFGLGFLGDRPLIEHFVHPGPVHEQLRTSIDTMQSNIKGFYRDFLEAA